MKKIIIFLLMLFSFGGISKADNLYLKSGSVLTGQIIKETEDMVEFKDDYTDEVLTYYRDNINRLDKTENKDLSQDSLSGFMGNADIDDIIRRCSKAEDSQGCEAKFENYQDNKTIYEQFLKNRDASLCNKLEGDEEIQRQCYELLTALNAVEEQNPEKCSSITHEAVRKGCHVQVERFKQSGLDTFAVPAFEQLPLLWGIKQ